MFTYFRLTALMLNYYLCLVRAKNAYVKLVQAIGAYSN